METMTERYGVISIHSSHTGRDAVRDGRQDRPQHFNPLFPYGKRQECQSQRRQIHDFNPLFPYGKRPLFRLKKEGVQQHFNPLFPYGKRRVQAFNGAQGAGISIHSSHTGRDFPAPWGIHSTFYFNPLFPYGKRHGQFVPKGQNLLFQSTLPIREETRGLVLPARAQGISIHSSHTGRDGGGRGTVDDQIVISIHSSHTGRNHAKQG